MLITLSCWPKTAGLCREIQALLVAGMEVRLEVNAEKVALYFHVSSKRIRDTVITQRQVINALKVWQGSNIC